MSGFTSDDYNNRVKEDKYYDCNNRNNDFGDLFHDTILIRLNFFVLFNPICQRIKKGNLCVVKDYTS